MTKWKKNTATKSQWQKSKALPSSNAVSNQWGEASLQWGGEGTDGSFLWGEFIQTLTAKWKRQSAKQSIFKRN
jgi:hypothetical protein